MSDSVPNCTRVLITAIYADGSSEVFDVPEPAIFEYVYEQITPETDPEIPLNFSYYDRFMTELTKHRIRVTVDASKYIRKFVSPISE